MRTEIRDVRTEIRDVRTELGAEIRDVRTELGAEIRDVRTEVADVRAEIRDVRLEIRAVRTEFGHRVDQVEGRVRRLEADAAADRTVAEDPTVAQHARGSDGTADPKPAATERLAGHARQAH